MNDTTNHPKRDHGGNLDAAIERYGGAVDGWIDLSTGINPVPYPVPDIPPAAWHVLPRRSDMARLLAAASDAYETTAPIAAFAGAQGAIQAVPYLRAPGHARVIAPTYNEHAAALRAAGWHVQEVRDLSDLAGSDLGVVVNPNNPDGMRYAPEALGIASQSVGALVVDESFADAQPELSLAPLADRYYNVLVLRSFGKFYGLAGARLGFALGSAGDVARLQDLAGPWPVSGPAIEIACAAFADTTWQHQTIARLERDAAWMDQMAQRAGFTLVGGTPLFRTYAVENAETAQRILAENHIWSRVFPYSANWIRLGLAGSASDWGRVETCFARMERG